MHGPQDLVTMGCLLLHRETGTVGVATRYHEPGQWVSPLNQKPVDGPVMELATGDAFLIKGPDTFVPLGAREADLFELAVKMTAKTVDVLAKAAAASRVPRGTIVVLLQAALRQMAKGLGEIIR